MKTAKNKYVFYRAPLLMMKCDSASMKFPTKLVHKVLMKFSEKLIGLFYFEKKKGDVKVKWWWTQRRGCCNGDGTGARGVILVRGR